MTDAPSAGNSNLRKHKAIAKEFYINSEYMFSNVVEATGLNSKDAMDLLYDYKEKVFGEFVNERIYP